MRHGTPKGLGADSQASVAALVPGRAVADVSPLLDTLQAPTLVSPPQPPPTCAWDQASEPWPLSSKKYHFFICHHQSSGGDQSHILKEGLENRGYKIWYDNGQHAAERNLAGMEEGVRQSCCLLVFLSGRRETNSMADPTGVYEGVFTRWFCHKELAKAREFNLPVVGVREEGRSPEDKSNVADFAEERRRARTGKDGGPISEHAEDILVLLEGPQSVVFLPFRRQQHEKAAMLSEIVRIARDKVARCETPWTACSSAPFRVSSVSGLKASFRVWDGRVFHNITSYEHLRRKLHVEVGITPNSTLTYLDAAQRQASLGDDDDLQHAVDTAQRAGVIELRRFEAESLGTRML